MSKNKKNKVNHLKKLSESDNSNKKHERKYHKMIVIIIVLVTFAAFANALKNEFLTWDDKDYVTENVYIKDLSPAGIKTIFKVFVSCHYHPFTLLSLAIDHHLWGTKAGGYIFTNILLHILSAVIVFFLFLKITHRKDIAFITAILFSIHPMRVESVVWIAERKDVLFSVFFFLSLFFYVNYIEKRKLSNYSLTLLFFITSLFSKATAVSLPLLLLLFDIYKGRRDYKKMLLEKIPFFILSLVFGLLAMKAQSLALPNDPPLKERFFLISYAISFYLFKFIAPFNQSAIIPFPEAVNGVLPLKYYFSVLIIPAVGFIIFKFKTYRKELLFATGLFILPLILVLIKFPIGPAYLAERYTYLPYIGPAFLTGFLYYKYTENKNLMHTLRNPFFVALLLFTFFFFVKTILRTQVWRNSYTLFSDVVDKNPTYAFALSNKGNALALKGKHNEAIKQFSLAIKYKPDFADAYNNRATSFFAIKDYENVVNDLNISINISPENEKIASMHHNRGLALSSLNRHEDAIVDFNTAIEKTNGYIDAYKSRMKSFIALEQLDSALSDLDFIMSFETNNPEHFNQKGILYAEKGDFGNALIAFSNAINIKPEESSYYVNRGFVYLNTDMSLACSDFSKAANLNNQTGRELLNLHCR